MSERDEQHVAGPGFRAAAFGDWVPVFAAANRTLSSVVGAATHDEIAAYRGFFACRTLRTRNILMLQAYLCPLSEWDDTASGVVDALLTDPLPPDQLYATFLKLAPFRHANRRSARALRMSRRLAAGDEPQTDRIWTELADAHGIDSCAPESQFTRTPEVSPYVIQTFGSA